MAQNAKTGIRKYIRRKKKVTCFPYQLASLARLSNRSHREIMAAVFELVESGEVDACPDPATGRVTYIFSDAA